MSLPPRGAWIEIMVDSLANIANGGSLPPRGAWIEITKSGFASQKSTVAPPTGSVD